MFFKKVRPQKKRGVVARGVGKDQRGLLEHSNRGDSFLPPPQGHLSFGRERERDAAGFVNSFGNSCCYVLMISDDNMRGPSLVGSIGDILEEDSFEEFWNCDVWRKIVSNGQNTRDMKNVVLIVYYYYYL